MINPTRPINSGSNFGGSIGPSQNVAKPPSMGGLGNSMVGNQQMNRFPISPGGNYSGPQKGNASIGGSITGLSGAMGSPSGINWPSNILNPGMVGGGYTGLGPSPDFGGWMSSQPQLQFPQPVGNQFGGNPDPNSWESPPFIGSYGGNSQPPIPFDDQPEWGKRSGGWVPPNSPAQTIGPSQPNQGRFGKL